MVTGTQDVFSELAYCHFNKIPRNTFDSLKRRMFSDLHPETHDILKEIDDFIFNGYNKITL